MPLLNYTTTVPVNRTISEIHGRLVEAGARRLMTTYNTIGQPIGIAFEVETLLGIQSFELPANLSSIERVLKAEKVAPRYRTPEQAARIGWRILKDWVEAQLALIRTGMATLDQVMFPYMQALDGRTVYQLYLDEQLPALEAGSS